MIEKLSQLRDGKIVPQKQSPSVVAGVPPASGKHAADTRATTAAAVSESCYNESAPRVAETSPDANELWQKILAKVPAQKAFVRNSAAAAHVLGIEGRNFQLGFAPGDKAMMDILGTQANRRFLETLLNEITGTDWSLKLSVKEELPSKQSLTSEDSRSENFKKDPLIQEAIGLFNAQIVPET